MCNRRRHGPLCPLPSLCKRKISNAKNAIILQCCPQLSDFCRRPRLTQPVNHTIKCISWCIQNLYSLLLKKSVVSADITISGKLFRVFTILGAKENFLKSLRHVDNSYLLSSGYDFGLLPCCFSRYKFILPSYLLVNTLRSRHSDTSVFKSWQF